MSLDSDLEVVGHVTERVVYKFNSARVWVKYLLWRRLHYWRSAAVGGCCRYSSSVEVGQALMAPERIAYSVVTTGHL